MRGIATGGSRGPAGADGADGVGVPVGGTSGQVLVKSSNTDFDTGWVDMAASSPGAGEYLYGKKLLYDNTLSADGVFGPIMIPQDYDHLEILGTLRGTNAEPYTSITITINGDTTTTNYRKLHHYYGSAHGVIYEDNRILDYVAGSGSPVGNFGWLNISIPNYSKATHKTLHYRMGRNEAAVGYNGEGESIWKNTSAITQIELSPPATFLAGSRLQIFGVGNRLTGQGVSTAYVGEQLYRQVVGVGGQASFDISGIPGGYDRLELFLNGKTNIAGVVDGVRIAFNGDTTDTNYKIISHIGGTTSASGTGDIRVGFAIGGAGDPESIGTAQVLIDNYASALRKIARIVAGHRRNSTDGYSQDMTLQWESNNPITRVTLVPETGTLFAEGTLCTVLGYRNRILESSPVVARYSTDAGQSIPYDTYAIINFEDKVVDTASAVTTGASWRFTCPSGGDGNYRVDARILFNASNAWGAGELLEMSIYKNGVIYSVIWREQRESSVAVYNQAGGSDIVPLSAGDYIEIRVYQGSGGALALYNGGSHNYIAIARV